MISPSNAAPRKFHGEAWRNCGHKYYGCHPSLWIDTYFALRSKNVPRPALTAVKVSIVVPRTKLPSHDLEPRPYAFPLNTLISGKLCARNASSLRPSFTYLCVGPLVQHVFQPDQPSFRRKVARCSAQGERGCIRTNRECPNIYTWRCRESSIRAQGHNH